MTYRLKTRMSQKQKFVTAFLLPAIIIGLLLSLYPMIEAVNLSLHNSTLRSPHGKFVGIQNYLKLFSDSRFWNALKISFFWELITVIGTLVVGIFIALILYGNVGVVFKNFLTLFFIMPVVLPRIAAAYQWKFMYSPLLGIFNYFFGLLGIKPVEFLANKSLALYSIAVIDIWQWGLLASVLILGLIESLPPEPLEAACLDGVTRWQLYSHIVLPMIFPSLVSLIFFKAMESLRSFDLIYVLTKGGPGITTETIDLFAYQTGVGVAGRISYASCVSILMLVLTTILTTILWRTYRRWFGY